MPRGFKCDDCGEFVSANAAESANAESSLLVGDTGSMETVWQAYLCDDCRPRLVEQARDALDDIITGDYQ